MNTIQTMPIKLEDINHLIQTDPSGLVSICEENYKNQVKSVVKNIAENHKGRKIIMLSGPSCSGKTTTAHHLTNLFRQYSIGSTVISLDDFYLGREIAPKLPDGSYDYESVHALDIGQMTRSLLDLIREGCCTMPRFSFITGKPEPDMVEVKVSENDVIIVEGIHAMNPLVVRNLPENQLFKLYITIKSKIFDEEGHVMSRRALRLSRRIIRDYKFRNSTPENTLDMWNEVEAGEDKYLFPYEPLAQIKIDSLHSYEPSIMRDHVLPLLKTIPADTPNYFKIEKLENGLKSFEPLDLKYLPADSLLREFLG